MPKLALFTNNQVSDERLVLNAIFIWNKEVDSNERNLVNAGF